VRKQVKFGWHGDPQQACGSSAFDKLFVADIYWYDGALDHEEGENNLHRIAEVRTRRKGLYSPHCGALLEKARCIHQPATNL
jgi:hypothetical protein